MTADQRKKWLNAANLVGCTSTEQYRVKRTKFELPQYDLNMRSNISLAWDNKKKSVISKKEQIAISQSHLRPFIGDGPRGQNILADVFSVPEDIFDLEDLSKVLSYEVWLTQLSENERSLLSQFLPKGSEPDEVIQELLAGDNFHFGNLFLKWGASLCFGKLHPDNILHEEQSAKASKMAYYSDLQKYHKDMIKNLQIWKEQWASYKDSGEDILRKMWRKGILDRKYDNVCNGLKVVARPKKGEKLDRLNFQHDDGAKYMSYIKVSKEQYQRAKSTMKLTSNSIRPRSLTKILRDINVHAQPFEAFEEEERKKLHDYWLQLANKYVSGGFANWRKRQLERQQITQTLGQELRQKLKLPKAILDEEKEDSHDMIPELEDDSQEEILPTMMVNGEADHEMAMAIEGEKGKNDCLIEKQKHNVRENTEDADDSTHIFIQDDCQQQISSLNESPRFTPVVESLNPGYIQNQQYDSPQVKSMEMESHGHNSVADTNEDPFIVSGCPRNQNHVDVSQRDPLPSVSDVWAAVNMCGSYYPSTSESDKYASASEMSLGHLQFIKEQPVRMIDLETDRQDKKDMLYRQPDDMFFFGSYPTQDRDEQIQSLFKGQGNSPYHQEQKTLQLDIQPVANLMMGAAPFSRHFREQTHLSLPLDLRQNRLDDLYMHQNIQGTLYSDGDRYTFPRQEHLPVNVHDCVAVNTVCMSAPSQSHLNGALSQNLYPGESEGRGGSSAFEGAIGLNHSLSSVSKSDQRLHSILTECSELRRGATYDSKQQFIQSEDYGGMGGGMPSTSIMLQRSPNPLHYLSGLEAAPGLKINNLGWTGIPQQNSGLPYIGTWVNHS
ncbi:hypothetical protein Fot_06262 [Forsythia ovata]|uniref:DEUBAD domain-containing protein n=1 Tax=Forsythia ovata TaxID=205694 RepID=A0ABD1WSI9_9LAMI